jgi:hypothetical protein
MPPGSFKSDESFLSKLAKGASGTRKVFEHLAAQGHELVELERGSMSFKIWRKTIKRKRIRLPDILCVRCARRFESRGKAVMEISMSHSEADAQRSWDAGLDPNDFVALVGVSPGPSGKPVDWIADDLVQYLLVRDLKAAFDRADVSISARKGAEEGSEVRVAWPAAIAASDGEVAAVSHNTIQLRIGGITRRFRLLRGGVHMTPHVVAGDTVRRNQIIASGVPVSHVCGCPGGATLATYMAKATSVSLTDRYMAVKALKRFDDPEALNTLRNRVTDEAEDIYVKVEAAAALLARDHVEGFNFIEGVLSGEHPQFKLEAAIVLADVATQRSADLLRRTLRKGDEHPDIRAAAAWSLGEIGLPNNIDALIESFGALESEIRVDAARALAKLARQYQRETIAQFPHTPVDRRAGVAWAIGRTPVAVNDLLPAFVDDDARHWIAYMIGVQDPTTVTGIAELQTRDAELYFAVTVLWKIYGSWINNLEEY